MFLFESLLYQVYRNNSNGQEGGGAAIISPKSTMSNVKYNFSFAGTSFPTSSRSSLRSIEKLEATGNNQLPAFEYEFKRKPYASFNSYTIIPPIKNKNNYGNEESSIQANQNEENVDAFHEQELTFSKSHKFANVTNNNHSVQIDNKKL